MDEYKVTASPVDGTYNYRWSSEDPAVATVDNNGLIKAVGEGNTFILVEADGLTNRIEVTSLTKIALESVSLSEAELELFYGDEVRIIATYYPENYNYASEIVWYSENPEIATVVNGEVKVTGTIPVPSTGAWGTYRWVSTPEDKLTVSLTEGAHRVKYYFEGGHNFRSLRFTNK